MKRIIQPLDYSKEILLGVQKGVLLTTKTDEKVNSMVISWGTLGIDWSKPIFTAFIREHRFTKHQLDINEEFTINIPVGSYDKHIISVCGTKSGHDIDKVQELGLTLVEGEKVSVPGIKEFPLTLECKVIYKQQQDAESITPENKKLFYPQDIDSTFHGSNKDLHTAYYGEIVNAYIIE